MGMVRRSLLVTALLLPPAATAIVPEFYRYPRRFAEVVPGKLYRGGYPSARQIRSLQRDKRIRTVVSMTGKNPTPRERESLAAIEELKLDHRRFPMPGNGCGEFDLLDRAADALNQEAAWPLYFHCAAGKQRSNAVLAAYRLKHCGWSLERALSELVERYDLDREGKEGVLVRHLSAYAKRLAAASPRNGS